MVGSWFRLIFGVILFLSCVILLFVFPSHGREGVDHMIRMVCKIQAAVYAAVGAGELFILDLSFLGTWLRVNTFWNTVRT